ncbi:MAG: hypothetical protein FWE12_03395 [Oscillospiraceae bacterium]|nr:hypothetical protein [Oscillospiraceae bacterium]
MKKILILLLIVLMVGTLLTGCTDNEAVVTITDRAFLTQIVSINRNADQYEGRTIRYEGMFYTFYWEATGEYYHRVLRYVMDCCGDDGIAGFEVYLGNIAPLPDNAWVELVGVLEWYQVGQSRFLRVAATSITELENRGQEFVTP